MTVDLLKALNMPIELLGDFLGKDLKSNEDNIQKTTFEKDEMKVTIWKEGEITDDECEELAREYGIMSIPALFLFKDGTLIDKKIGYQELEELKSWLASKI